MPIIPRKPHFILPELLTVRSWSKQCRPSPGCTCHCSCCSRICAVLQELQHKVYVTVVLWVHFTPVIWVHTTAVTLLGFVLYFRSCNIKYMSLLYIALVTFRIFLVLQELQYKEYIAAVLWVHISAVCVYGCVLYFRSCYIKYM